MDSDADTDILSDEDSSQRADMPSSSGGPPKNKRMRHTTPTEETVEVIHIMFYKTRAWMIIVTFSPVCTCAF